MTEVANYVAVDGVEHRVVLDDNGKVSVVTDTRVVQPPMSLEEFAGYFSHSMQGLSFLARKGMAEPAFKQTMRVPTDDRDGMCGVKFEDGKCAAIVYEGENQTTSDEEMFVRIHSWDETGEHALFRSLMGKRVKVSIEILD